MVDAVDSKSTGVRTVPVQVRALVLKFQLVQIEKSFQRPKPGIEKKGIPGVTQV